MRKQRIFIDMDEVLADFLTDFALLCNEKLGTNVTKEDFKEWNIPRALGVAPEQVWPLFSTQGLFANLKPIPGAIESVKRLMADERFDVLFLSASTSEFSCSEKRGWIKRHLGYEAAHRLILTTRKDVVGREQDLLIDDRPKNILEWPGDAILFDAPHNQSFQFTEPYMYPFRARNWREILNHLDVP